MDIKGRGTFGNTAINVAGALLPVFVTLFTAPLYLKHIGTSRYGVLAVVWILLGHLGFMDLGLSRASENALAKIGSSSKKERGLVLVTSGYLNLALGLIGSIILFTGGKLAIAMHLIASQDLREEFNAALPWIAAMLPLSLLGGVGIGSIESRGNFIASNVLRATDNIFGSCFPILAAILIGPSLSIIVPAVVLGKLVNLISTLYVVVKNEGPLEYFAFDRVRGKSLFGYGIWVSASNVIAPVLTSVDQLLIGSVLGPAALAHYNIPMSLASRTQVLAASLARALFPSLSRMDENAATELAHRSTLVLSYLVAAVCGPAIIASDEFFRIWLGPDFAERAAPVAKILMLGAWINSVAFVCFSLLQARGRPDLVAKVYLLEVLPFVAILWLLLATLGLTGAAIAWCVRVFVDTSLLLWLTKFRLSQYLRLLPAGLVLICAYMVSFVPSGGSFQAALLSVTFGALILAIGVFTNPGLRSLALRFSRRFRIV